jgi:membrane protease YdiL (CAAX protease family)
LIWIFAALLVVWGNVVSSLLGASARLPGGSWPFVVTGAALVATALLFARHMRLDGVTIGLGPGAIRGAAVGAAIAAAVALIGVALLRFVAPAIVGTHVDYAPLQQVTESGLLLHIAGFLPFGAVIPEEVAFRGVLFGALLRARGGRIAILGSSAAFALWHAAVAVVTVGDTTIGPPSPWFVPAVAGALVVVLAGGAAFATLRLRTGTIASTIAAHWTFNAIILLGLWFTKPVPQFAP